MKFFIFGAGFTGQTFARKCSTPVYGTTRTTTKLVLLSQNNIEPILFNQTGNQTKLRQALKETTHLIISIAPDEAGDPILRQKNILQDMPNLQWIAYLSTIGVYGDHQGNWIDEEAICNPSLARNQRRLIAENEWQDFANKRCLPLSVLRLSGIYGAGRNAFIKLNNGTAHRIIKKNQVFNRIHVEDIAGVLQYFSKQKQNGLFNISDDMPCPPQDVITYAAKLMGIEPPTEISFENADLSPILRAFYSDNKKILVNKLKDVGYSLSFPDYKSGLDSIWRTNNCDEK